MNDIYFLMTVGSYIFTVRIIFSHENNENYSVHHNAFNRKKYRYIEILC